MVVDADEDDFVARSAPPPASISVDSVTDAFDASELLCVDMEQIAGRGMLVPPGRIPLFLEPPDPTDAFSFQMLRHGRHRHAQFTGDLPGRLPSPSEANHPLHQLSRGPFRETFWPAASVFQTLRSAFSEAIQPLMGRLAAHACGASRLGHGPLIFLYSTNEKKTRLRRKLGVRMELHLGFLSKDMDWFRNPISSNRTSGVNNVFGSHN
jgi:hypothetical protein